MLPSHPSLGLFWSRLPQLPQYLSLCPYVWGVLVTHTKNQPGLVRLGAFCGPSYSFPVSLFGNGIGIEIEIGFATEFEIGIGAEIATVPEPEIGIEIVIEIGIVIVIVIGTRIGLVRLNELFCFGSSFYAESWWGHGGGYPSGLYPHLMAPGEGHCPPSVSIQ